MKELSIDVGSPLANVLVWRELSVLSWPHARKLVKEPPGFVVGDRIARQIFVLTGGHPFLIQVLMAYLCSTSEMPDAALDTAVQIFNTTQTHQFRNWVAKLDATDREVYAYLAVRRGSQAKHDLVLLVGDAAANDAVSVLCHTGVVRESLQDQRFRTTGILFRSWFMNEVAPSVPPTACDRRILQKLESLDPNLGAKYLSAWSILRVDLPNYSGAVGEIRDVVTLVLHRLAPDDVIRADSTFVAEHDHTGRPLAPTRQQRAKFIGKQKGAHVGSLNNDLDLLETLVERLGRLVTGAYGRASARTHTVSSDEQAWRCLKQMDSVLAQLL